MSLLLEHPTTVPTIGEPVWSMLRRPPLRPVSPQHGVVPFGCVHARSVRHRGVMAVTVYDCVRFVVVRDGSIILTSDAAPCSATAGDVVMVAPNTRFGYEPEGIVTVTTVAVDTDYLVEQFFWQHVDVLPDRLTAYDHAARLYPEPVQVLRAGEAALALLGPLLDDLETLTNNASGTERFLRVQALLFTTLDLLAPHITTTPAPPVEAEHGGRCRDRAVSRWALLRPARAEAREAAEAMRADLARRWRVDDLAAQMCLSSSQFERVFKAHYGLSPLAYLTMLRVREMARLLRTTDLLVAQICPRVGWKSPHHPAGHFRRYYGVTPTEYRRYGPHTASQGGPGAAVGRVRDDHAEQR